MYRIREETGHPPSRQRMKSLHVKYMALARNAEVNGDRVLAEGYYQHAEHYLHAMNEPGDPVTAATAYSSLGVSRPVKRVIKDLDFDKTFLQEALGTREKTSPEGNVLPFRGHFLRRPRRRIQDKEISE